jgi:hypothetical protein
MRNPSKFFVVYTSILCVFSFIAFPLQPEPLSPQGIDVFTRLFLLKRAIVSRYDVNTSDDGEDTIRLRSGIPGKKNLKMTKPVFSSVCMVRVLIS